MIERVHAAVEQIPARRLFGVGVAGALGPLALAALPWTPFAADLALVALSVVPPALAWVGVILRAQLDALPLQIGPTIGTGTIDGVRVYRFRVRLGRGRRAALPSAQVWFEDPDGETFALPARIPAAELIGPFTIVTPDPEHICAGPGRFHVEVSCDAQGRRWITSAVLDKGAVADGWFAGVAPEGPGIRFTPQWSAVEDP